MYDSDLLNLYKILINIRKENDVLSYGSYKTIYSHRNVIAFEREYNREKIIVIINNNYEEKNIKINLNIKVNDIINLKV